MPSLLHEGLLLLVRDHPELLATLLRELLGVEVPAFTEARLAETALHELVPVEYHADVVVLLVGDVPVFGAIVEAQLQPDPRKLFTWPLYGVAARARHECPFAVVVVTPDAATARWADRSIDLGNGACYPVHVIGPDRVPIITEVERAKRQPYLVLLSVMAHGQGDVTIAVAIARAAVAAIEQLAEDQRLVYSAIVETALGEAARKAIEMHPDAMKFLSESQRRSWAEGEARGEARGQARGEATGLARGEAKGQASAVLQVLARRGIAVGDGERERILGCRDLATLTGWLDRALTITAIEQLFA